jgi:hypothetical protein
VVVVEAQVIILILDHPLLDKVLLDKVTLVDCRHKFLVVTKRKAAAEARVQQDFLLMLPP